eukprot:352927-Chlamydomonas_euryale.AAC.1
MHACERRARKRMHVFPTACTPTHQQGAQNSNTCSSQQQIVAQGACARCRAAEHACQHACCHLDGTGGGMTCPQNAPAACKATRATTDKQPAAVCGVHSPAMSVVFTPPNAAQQPLPPSCKRCPNSPSVVSPGICQATLQCSPASLSLVQCASTAGSVSYGARDWTEPPPHGGRGGGACKTGNARRAPAPCQLACVSGVARTPHDSCATWNAWAGTPCTTRPQRTLAISSRLPISGAGRSTPVSASTHNEGMP